jgi:hypothetical protein
VSTNKRKSFAKALSQKVDTIPKATEAVTDPPTDREEIQAPVLPDPAQDHPLPSPPPPKPPIRFTKFTFPLREDLHRQLSKIIARLNLERDVEVSMAILIRLGIEQVLAQLEHNPDGLLADLYELEQKEVTLSGDKRYTVNRGLATYIQRAIREARNP